MTAKLFEMALGISSPWYVAGTDFDAGAKTLTILVDFTAGSRFELAGVAGLHPVHDTVPKRYRHLNFFEHECFLEVRVPRVKLPDGGVRLVEAPWTGKLSGFTLLFEALVLMLCQQMTFAAAARLVGESRHRVAAICERYVELTLAHTDLSAVRELAIDETSRARGHDYISLAADALERRVVAVAEGRSADSIAQLVREIQSRGAAATKIRSVSIDMSPAFIKGCAEHLPNARITFDKFHVIWHANAAVDRTRRIEQRTNPSLKGLRWPLLKDRLRLSHTAAANLDTLIAHITTVRTARAWAYKEQLREILNRKQINVTRSMLLHWCTCVMRSKVQPMKEVANMIRNNLAGITAWAQTRQTNGFLEALNGLFQSAKRRARGFTRFATIRTVIFLIAGKLNFRTINPHAN